ncbi:unnamed protein product [Closterium sp. NIES-54]
MHRLYSPSAYSSHGQLAHQIASLPLEIVQQNNATPPPPPLPSSPSSPSSSSPPTLSSPSHPLPLPLLPASSPPPLPSRHHGTPQELLSHPRHEPANQLRVKVRARGQGATWQVVATNAAAVDTWQHESAPPVARQSHGFC